MSIQHMCLSISGGIKNAAMLKGCITVDGKTLHTVKEIKDYLNYQLSLGREVLPMSSECKHFDYIKGCQCRFYKDGEKE